MSMVETKKLLSFGEHVQAERLGLAINEDMPFEEWVALGRKLGAMANSSAWWIGDWVNQGEIVYGGKYEEALAITGLDYQTLANCAHVARAFPEISRRREKLSFGHHATLTALEPSEQDEWLARSAEQEWSVMQLRNELRASRALPGDGNGHVALQRIQIDAPADRAERWRAAAERSEKPFGEWAAEVLDQAAA